jgi:hypothetical protein
MGFDPLGQKNNNQAKMTRKQWQILSSKMWKHARVVYYEMRVLRINKTPCNLKSILAVYNFLKIELCIN